MRALITLAVAGVALAQAPSKPLDKPAIERYVRRLKLVTPQVQVTVGEPKPSPLAGLVQVPVQLSFNQSVQEMTLYMSRDGRYLVEGNIYEMGRSPFQREMDLIRTEQQPAFGAAAGAPLSLVVFSDFQCPMCREEAKVLREKIPVEFGKDVRVYFKDFPLEQIHNWARAGAVAGRAVYRLSGPAFWDYHDWVFEHQNEINSGNFRAKLLEWAKNKGLDTAALSKLIDTRAVDGEVDASVAEARKLGVASTPTAFLNGRKLVGSVPWNSMSNIIKAELGYIGK